MARTEVVNHFIKYPGNLDTGAGKLAKQLSKKFFGIDKQEIYDAKKEARTIIKRKDEDYWFSGLMNPIKKEEDKWPDKPYERTSIGFTKDPFESFNKTVSGDINYNQTPIQIEVSTVAFDKEKAAKFIAEWHTINPNYLSNLVQSLDEEDKKYYAGFGYKKEERILVIFDLHAPFIREGYLEFCKSIYDKYECNKIVLTGDCIDSHFSSFWNTDPDGHSAGEELRLAKLQLKGWHDTFPNAYVCIGNHDRIPDRKRFNAGLSKEWMRKINEVLETPTWEYAEEFVFNDVKYCHGEGRSAESRMLQDQISVVQGHWHSKSYIINNVGKKSKTFAMQGGCGIDDKAYAFAYGKNFQKSHINCGVVLNNGELPILEYMPL